MTSRDKRETKLTNKTIKKTTNKEASKFGKMLNNKVLTPLDSSISFGGGNNAQKVLKKRAI